MRISDWSSDVCSSDLLERAAFEDHRWVVNHDEGHDEDGDSQAERRQPGLHGMCAGYGGRCKGGHADRGRDGGDDAEIEDEEVRCERLYAELDHAGRHQDGEHDVSSERRQRSEERRVGEEWGSTSRSRWSPENLKKKK